MENDQIPFNEVIHCDDSNTFNFKINKNNKKSQQK